MSGPTRRFTRAGVLGDVHAEDERLRRAYRAFDAAGVDIVLCVGDVVDGAGDVEACIELLARRGAAVVLGNHDRWFLHEELRNLPLATAALSRETSDQLLSWPTTLDFETPRGRLRLAHGVGLDDMAELRPDTRGYALQATGVRDLMLESALSYHLGGHTHIRMVRAFPGLVALNAGTLSGEEPVALLLDFGDETATYLDLAADELTVKERLVIPRPLALPDST